jgi:hypothetical protein
MRHLSKIKSREVGLNTGAGKPAVFPKRVLRVRVQFLFLAHRGTPLPVPRCCGYSRVIYILNLFIYNYNYNFLSYHLFNILVATFERSLKLRKTSDPIIFIFILLLWPLTTTPSYHHPLVNARSRAPTRPHCHLAPNAQNEAQAASGNKPNPVGIGHE